MAKKVENDKRIPGEGDNKAAGVGRTPKRERANNKKYNDPYLRKIYIVGRSSEPAGVTLDFEWLILALNAMDNKQLDVAVVEELKAKAGKTSPVCSC